MKLNARGKVSIGGLELDNPLESPIVPKVEERKDGARTTVRSVWLDRYLDLGESVCYESHFLEMTNRGVVTLDGRQLKEKESIDAAREIFSELDGLQRQKPR